MTGTIARIIDRGFGFIHDDHKVTYFFAARECYSPFDSLKTGDAVAFDEGIDDTGKGPRAIRVARLVDLDTEEHNG